MGFGTSDLAAKPFVGERNICLSARFSVNVDIVRKLQASYILYSNLSYASQSVLEAFKVWGQETVFIDSREYARASKHTQRPGQKMHRNDPDGN